MKGLKKLLTGILAATMIISSSITAFAATEDETSAPTGTLTIDNPIEGQTYTVYKMFDFEAQKDDKGNEVPGKGVYKITEEWRAFVTTGAGKDYLSVDANGYVSLKDGVTIAGGNTDTRDKVLEANVGDAQKLAQAALAYAKDSDNKISEVTHDKAGQKGADGKVPAVTFENLGYGYYLVDSTAGALVGLNTLTGGAVTIKEKNDSPSIKKEVKEDSTGTFQKQNDAEVGDVIEYKTTIDAKAHGVGYVLYDKMSKGLQFNKNSVKVSVDNKDVATGTDTWTIVTEGVKYPDTDEDADFVITFAPAYTKAFDENKEIVVTYTATVTKDAVKNTAIPNKTILEFGNKTKTKEDETRTYVWGIEVIKYTGTNLTSGQKLAGAEFVIYKKVEGGVVYAIVVDGKLTGWTTAVDATAEKDLLAKDTKYFTDQKATSLVSDSKGRIDVEGFDADDKYYLLETKAPLGFNKADKATEFVIKSTNNAAGATLENELKQVDGDKNPISVLTIGIENKTGSLLPSTGGMGTTIFYILGGLLIVAGVAYFIVRRKASAE